jgi:hypothetical protein
VPRHSCQCIPGLHTARYSECGRIPEVDALKQLDSSPASKCQTVLPVTATGYVCSDGDFECAQSLDQFVQTVATVRVSDLPRVGLGDGTAISKHRNYVTFTRTGTGRTCREGLNRVLYQRTLYRPGNTPSYNARLPIGRA